MPTDLRDDFGMEIPDEWRRHFAWIHRTRGARAETVSDTRSQDIYSRLIKETVSPAMRELGLVGSGGRYSLKSESHWALIGFQKSAYSDRDEVRFTVNLLAVGREPWDQLVRDKLWVGEKPTALVSYGSPVRQLRIGKLVDDGEDKWWRVYVGQDMTLIAADVLANLRDAGVPWLRAQIAQG